MNKKITTTEDILNDRTMFTEKQAAKIRANIEKKQKKYGAVHVKMQEEKQNQKVKF